MISPSRACAAPESGTLVVRSSTMLRCRGCTAGNFQARSTSASPGPIKLAPLSVIPSPARTAARTPERLGLEKTSLQECPFASNTEIAIWRRPQGSVHATRGITPSRRGGQCSLPIQCRGSCRNSGVVGLGVPASRARSSLPDAIALRSSWEWPTVTSSFASGWEREKWLRISESSSSVRSWIIPSLAGPVTSMPDMADIASSFNVKMRRAKRSRLRPSSLNAIVRPFRTKRGAPTCSSSLRI